MAPGQHTAPPMVAPKPSPFAPRNGDSSPSRSTSVGSRPGPSRRHPPYAFPNLIFHLNQGT